MPKMKLFKNESGQGVVEMALVLPLLIILILGMVEFGWILNGQITLTSAAREGARAAIIYETATQASQAVQSAVLQSVGPSSLIGVTTTTTFTGQRAIVTVDATIKPIIGLFVQGNLPLHAKAEMRIE